MLTVATLVAGIGFTEGPLWTSDGRLLVTSLSRRCVYELTVDGDVRTVASLDASPSGLAEDGAGRVWIVHAADTRDRAPDEREGGVSVFGSDGEVQLVAHEGLTAPNDCLVGPDGRLWFSDPAGEPMAGRTEPGAVRALDLNTYEVSSLATGCQYPNGVAVSPDGAYFYVAETAMSRITRFRVQDRCRLTERVVFYRLLSGRPDGLTVDPEGNLYIAATTGDCVVVVGAEGRLLAELPLGDGTFPTNVTFGDVGRRTLFVTAARGGRVLALRADWHSITASQ